MVRGPLSLCQHGIRLTHREVAENTCGADRAFPLCFNSIPLNDCAVLIGKPGDSGTKDHQVLVVNPLRLYIYIYIYIYKRPCTTIYQPTRTNIMFSNSIRMAKNIEFYNNYGIFIKHITWYYQKHMELSIPPVAAWYNSTHPKHEDCPLCPLHESEPGG